MTMKIQFLWQVFKSLAVIFWLHRKTILQVIQILKLFKQPLVQMKYDVTTKNGNNKHVYVRSLSS